MLSYHVAVEKIIYGNFFKGGKVLRKKLSDVFY